MYQFHLEKKNQPVSAEGKEAFIFSSSKVNLSDQILVLKCAASKEKFDFLHIKPLNKDIYNHISCSAALL